MTHTGKKTPEMADWLESARQILRGACTPWGIKASMTNLDNYGAIFTRDAVMAGIAGVLIKDEVIIEGFRQSLIHLRDLQGKQGQIASNFTMKDAKVAKVSFGTLSPKIDSCTWYLIGVGILIKEGLIEKDDFKTSVEKTIDLLEGIEYNGKHLMYIPKGGNWADEYYYEGYILYDQVLRAWGMSLLAFHYGEREWSNKAESILSCIEEQYSNTKKYFNSSFYPGGTFQKFDLAAHALLGIVFGKKHPFVEQSLDWIISEFLNDDKLPPVFYPAIEEGDMEWDPLRKYHLFAFKNKPHHYHNGGIWWIWLGWLSVTYSLWDKKAALKQLQKLSFDYLNSLEGFDFDEYVSADDLIPNGTKQLCYTATGIIFLALSEKSFDFSELKPKEIPLIKENIILKDEYFKLSSEIVNRLEHKSLLSEDKIVIGICGESGSGKSTTAKCLQIELEKLDIHSIILHQDSYYKLPPKENHEKRKSDLAWVGTNEVQMDLLQSHIQQFKTNKTNIIVPIVDYENNIFFEDKAVIKNKSVLIIEGVYSFFLQNFDYKIFMERTYKDTMTKREKRSREVYDPFVEQVLEIEHSIIQPLKKMTNLIIKKDYSISAINE